MAGGARRKRGSTKRKPTTNRGRREEREKREEERRKEREEKREELLAEQRQVQGERELAQMSGLFERLEEERGRHLEEVEETKVKVDLFDKGGLGRGHFHLRTW